MESYDWYRLFCRAKVIMISTWGLLRKYEEKFSHKKQKRKHIRFFFTLFALYVLFFSRHNNTDWIQWVVVQHKFELFLHVDLRFLFSLLLHNGHERPFSRFLTDKAGWAFWHNIIRLIVEMPCNWLLFR